MAGVGGEARRVEARIADIVSHLDLWGIIGAAALFTLGLTPSLLPRDWLYQGLVSGIAAGLGYTLGIALKHVWYRLVVRYAAPRYSWLDATTWPPRRYRLASRIASGVFVLWMVGFAVFAVRWQRQLADALAAPAPTIASYLLVVPLALAVFTAFLFILRVLRFCVRWLSSHFPHRFRAAYRVVGAVLIVALVGTYTVENLIPGAIDQVRIEGASHFLQEDRGELLAAGVRPEQRAVVPPATDLGHHVRWRRPACRHDRSIMRAGRPAARGLRRVPVVGHADRRGAGGRRVVDIGVDVASQHIVVAGALDGGEAVGFL